MPLVLKNVLKHSNGEMGSAVYVGSYRAENSRVMASHYPQCCTGAILSNFGGSGNAFGSNAEIGSLEEHLHAWIDFIREGKLGEVKCFISACTTEEQVHANKALENCGFIRHGGVVVNSQYDYDLITWVLALTEWED